MDIYADNPKCAAKRALAIQRDTARAAAVFQVEASDRRLIQAPDGSWVRKAVVDLEENRPLIFITEELKSAEEMK